MDTKLLVKLVREVVRSEIKKAIPVVVDSVYDTIINETRSQNQHREPKKQLKQGVQLSKNPVINNILNETMRDYTPSPVQYDTDDSFVLTTRDFGDLAGTTPDMIKSTLASKMGLSHQSKNTGLGIQTGNESLDAAFNRDYSQLVQRFKR